MTRALSDVPVALDAPSVKAPLVEVPSIEVRDLMMRYGSLLIMEDLSFSGACMARVGPAGPAASAPTTTVSTLLPLACASDTAVSTR